MAEEAPKVKKLSPNAILPSKSSSIPARYDLSSAAEVKVPARGVALVPTDLSIAVPEDTYAQIASREELALKHLIHVGAGVVDADYRGPVGVILFNHSDLDFDVKLGDYVAYLIIHKIIIDSLEVMKLSPNAIFPSRSSSLAAGYDLFSVAEVKVPARGMAIIPTDLSIVVSKDTCARIAPRSGLALKRLIDVGGSGVIETDYRGPLRVILLNYSNSDFDIKFGDRVAQLIIEKISSSSLAARNVLYSAAEVKVPAGGSAFIPTDLSIALPKDTYARIVIREELALTHSIHVGADVAVADERGHVGVVLFNHSDIDFVVKAGDCVAHLIIHEVETQEFVEVDDLDSTVRGSDGFGSTGVSRKN